MAVSIVGAQNTATAVEVEANTKAVRSTNRWDNFTNSAINGGHFGVSISLASQGTSPMAAGLAAAAPIISFRYFGNGACLVRRVLFGMSVNTTGFTAGSAQFNLFAARSFTAADTGGVTLLPGSTPSGTGGSQGDAQQLNSRSASAKVNLLASQTATLTAGTRTLDAQPLGSISVPVPATASAIIVPTTSPLLDQRLGEYPLVLANNEGWVVQATVPATGTWNFSFNCLWDELPSY